MLNVTEEARAVLKGVSVPDGTTLRLTASDRGSIELSFGPPAGDDHVVVDDGSEVLRVPSTLSETLGDASMDVNHEPEGPPLRLVLTSRPSERNRS